MPTTVDPSELSLTPPPQGGNMGVGTPSDPVKLRLGSDSVAAQPDATTVEAFVRSAATGNSLDPDHMAKLVNAESGFNTTADAHLTHPESHAYGPMQLEPATAKEMGVDATDWKQNIHGGMGYFKKLLDHFNGDYAKATLAWHDGQNAIEKGPPSTEALQLQHKVMGPQSSGQADNTGTSVDTSELSRTPPGTPTPQEPQPSQEPSGFWETLMGAITKKQSPGEGPTSPEFAQNFGDFAGAVKDNLPALAALGVSLAIPPMAGVEAPFLARAAMNLAPKILGAVGGGAAGGIAKEALEGKVPQSAEDVSRLINDYGIPQGAAEMLGGMVSTIFPAQKFANRVYQSAFKLTSEEADLGVSKTLQDLKIPTTAVAAQTKMKAINDGLNEAAGKLMAEHNPGIAPMGAAMPSRQIAAAGAPATAITRKAVNDKILEGAYDAVSKGMRDPISYLKEVEDEIALMNNPATHPTQAPTQFDFNYAQGLKQSYRAGVKFNSPTASDVTPQIRKMFAHSIDSAMEAIEPRLTPIHQLQEKVLDAMPAVDRSAAREGGKSFFTSQVGRPLASGLLGGAAATGIGYHDPQVALALGLIGSQLGNPRRYGELALLLKNNPVMMRQMPTFILRMLAQPASEDKRQQIKDTVKDTTSSVKDTAKNTVRSILPTAFNAPQ
jgi:hypothetical protein